MAHSGPYGLTKPYCIHVCRCCYWTIDNRMDIRWLCMTLISKNDYIYRTYVHVYVHVYAHAGMDLCILCPDGILLHSCYSKSDFHYTLSWQAVACSLIIYCIYIQMLSRLVFIELKFLYPKLKTAVRRITRWVHKLHESIHAAKCLNHWAIYIATAAV